jgi:ketosteroid isomerase-like protein
MNRRTAMLSALAGFVAEAAPQPGVREQVMEAERGFAATMARRDAAAFAAFVSDEAIFFAGEKPLRGKKTVVDAWKPFFAGPQAPFSWEPTLVEVLDSGTLALSTGPVKNPKGEVTAQFQSIWRLESGKWRVVFDKGAPVCKA